VFLINSRSGLVTATSLGSNRAGLHLLRGAPSPEVTVPFCLVPSPEFSQAPGDFHPTHLCRFRVRSHTTWSLEAFLGSRASITSSPWRLVIRSQNWTAGFA